MNEKEYNELPVVVVGAGPIGLAAATQLRERGLTPMVFERGPGAGAAVSQWNHVRVFSRWGELIDPAARRLLETTGWTAPGRNSYPTGKQWTRDYLVPLADALGDVVVFDTEVIGVARRGRDRVVDAGRDTEPLTVHVRRGDGSDARIDARAVIDASGTWGAPNPLGGDGLPALGELAASNSISYRVPDLHDPSVRARYAGRHTVIAGSGHSALTAIIALADLGRDAPGTRITWVLRRGDVGATFGGGKSDQLPARGALGERAKKAVDAGLLRVITGFRTATVDSTAHGQLALISDAGQRIDAIDRVVVLTGFRPDLSWLSEIRLGLDPVLQAPTALAPLIDPNIHSCGTVYPHGVTELTHPEPNVYLVGMKSYGRAPTFLAMTGYEQVRSIAAALAGDRASAERVELTLPDTGVCGGAGVFEDQRTTGSVGDRSAALADPRLITLSASGVN
ncbi:NAD(P)-binding domain-containing protein [Antrihabitans stalactiti]|uniref:Flavoprotein n=1 Tax=Antrihabitans stalactiti TaxID=2584121 RepID=A0A848KII6_9NOCA|nr:NAD(P)-binding domain-containing protein [Antrihabitans stalactiti]NMN96492.1 flavoprotein [Antrihabitans stalactiti]